MSSYAMMPFLDNIITSFIFLYIYKVLNTINEEALKIDDSFDADDKDTIAVMVEQQAENDVIDAGAVATISDVANSVPAAAVPAADVATAAATTTTTTAGSESSAVPIILWDTKVELVNPATDIVLASYPGYTGARFWARKCVESEAGYYNP